MLRHFDVLIERVRMILRSLGSAVAGLHTQARFLDEIEVMDRIREAIHLFVDVEGVTTDDLEFVCIQRITVAA